VRSYCTRSTPFWRFELLFASTENIGDDPCFDINGECLSAKSYRGKRKIMKAAGNDVYHTAKELGKVVLCNRQVRKPSLVSFYSAH